MTEDQDRTSRQLGGGKEREGGMETEKLTSCLAQNTQITTRLLSKGALRLYSVQQRGVGLWLTEPCCLFTSSGTKDKKKKKKSEDCHFCTCTCAHSTAFKHTFFSFIASSRKRNSLFLLYFLTSQHHTFAFLTEVTFGVCLFFVLVFFSILKHVLYFWH